MLDLRDVRVHAPTSSRNGLSARTWRRVVGVTDNPKSTMHNGEDLLLDPVATGTLQRLQIHGEGDDTVQWAGVFVSYGEHGADQSTTIVFEIEPGKRLGWHTDQTEETQYIIAGTGELRRDDGVFPVGPGSVFVLPTNVGHDLANTGTETMRCVAFFAAAMFTQKFDNVMQPVNSHVLGTPNREG
jgi:quercetin dioxygenase-like cupin family protein